MAVNVLAKLSVNSDNFEIISFKGTESLSSETVFKVTFHCQEAQHNSFLMGHNVSFQLISVDNFTSNKALTIVQKRIQSIDKENFIVELTLKPRLSLLKQTSQSRVIIDANIKTVITYLLTEAGYSHANIDWRLSSDLPNTAQFVQAMENNFALLQRLLAQYGLFYWFEMHDAVENIVISDNNLHSPYLERGTMLCKSAHGFNATEQAQFVGFTHSQLTSQITAHSAQCYDSSMVRGDFADKAECNFFEPVAHHSAQARLQAQTLTQSLHSEQHILTLTGNVPEVFAGCSIAIDDQLGTHDSGDYLVLSVEHHLTQQRSDGQDLATSQYHCVIRCIPRGTPFKLKRTTPPAKPMVFPAKVESLSKGAMLDEQGNYRTRHNLDKLARSKTNSSEALKKLSMYNCANQPHATGWHFPLVDDSDIVIGCVNNDPNQSFILGFALSGEQPAVVNANNAMLNRILTPSQNELLFDDDPQQPKVILQTLGSEHYLELNAQHSGRHFIHWMSQLGSINLVAGKQLAMQSENDNITAVTNQGLQTSSKSDTTFKADNNHIALQSATGFVCNANNTTFTSGQNNSLKTGRSIRAHAKSDIQFNTDKGGLSISAPSGATLINANGDITISGNGQGDLTLHNGAGEIKIDAQGNINIIATDVLTLKGMMTSLDAPVEYEITSPETASTPAAPQQPAIANNTLINIDENGELTATLNDIELNYTYQDGQPVDDIAYEVLDSKGTLHIGKLSSGQACLKGLPQGQCKVTYIGATKSDEQALIALLNQFKHHLQNMTTEVKQRAAVEEALFEQANFFEQWAIEIGARATGLYQGGKSLVTGIYDFAVFAVDINISVYTACFELMSNLGRGDTYAVKQQLETLLVYTKKSHQSLTQAFELLVVLIEDEETRSTLSTFPFNYIDAHSHVEKERITGIFAFEILLALLTAGVGVAASAASKSKHLVKANKALMDIADILKRKRLNRSKNDVLTTQNNKISDTIEKPKAELEAPSGNNTLNEKPDVNSKLTRLPAPRSIKEVMERLSIARQNIIKNGYQPKYNDTELLAMAKAGHVAKERFHVRIMDEEFLTYQGKPGLLGAPFEGKSGFGAKYWSTTFDQLEDADTDPKLIHLKLGLDYNPESNFVMVIIDTDKAKKIADTHTIVPTFEHLSAFAKQELPDSFTPEQLNKLLTPEFQNLYAKHYQAALDSKTMSGEWDIESALEFYSKTVEDKDTFKLLKLRLEMQDTLGNNQHFLGNGLTKTLLPYNGDFGAIETFNFERTLTNLEQFGDAIKVTDVLKPTGAK